LACHSAAILNIEEEASQHVLGSQRRVNSTSSLVLETANVLGQYVYQLQVATAEGLRLVGPGVYDSIQE
jgi:hypothetical protein